MIIARSSVLRHPTGVEIKTPLLVPSFSSKGFDLNNKNESEITNIYNIAGQYLSDTMLVSAYDIACGYMEKIDNAHVDLLFVDSGGYEVSSSYDLSTIVYRRDMDIDWTKQDLQKVYDDIPDHVPVVLVNYDHPNIRESIEAQAASAKSFFRRYPNQLHTFLIKPEKPSQKYIQIKNLISMTNKLNGFDIIGFTEKELGKSVLERMESISKIRLALDDEGIHSPIHIYGSLDPIGSILYFCAGAEIFDGLTWLRYGYHNSMACYYGNYGVFKRGISDSDDMIKIFMISDNISFLSEVKNQMLKYLNDGDFCMFGPLAEVARNAYDLLRAKNRRLRDGR